MELKMKNITLDGKETGNVFLNNGKVILKNCPQVEFIRIEFDETISPDSIVLGDGWERAYGDLLWEKPVFGKIYPWYLQNFSEGEFKGFGVMTGANAFCSWTIGKDSLSLTLDLRCGSEPLHPEEDFEACEIICMSVQTNDLFETCREFCKRMCRNPLLPDEPVYGGNNWYYAYGNSSDQEIIKDTDNIAAWSKGLKNRPFMVIDACWQPFMLMDEICAGGPYPHGNYLFPDMQGLAERMKEKDVRPGLWYRPMKTAQTLPPSFFIRPRERILDPTIPEVREIIKNDAKRLSGWGYELIKHDYSTFDFFGYWAFEMPDGIRYKDRYSFRDKTKTTAQAIKLLYSSILEGVTDRNGKQNSYIIGCNTVGHLAAGLTHIQRIGDDTSGLEWGRTRKMGVNCLAFRAPQHDRFFACDADCVGITDKIDWKRNAQWLDLVARSGTPLFVSADPKALTSAMESALTEAFAQASKPQTVCRPENWTETVTPNQWILNGKKADFNWD